MILEGIVTTRNEDGSTNIAPMGPDVDRSIRKLRLRPYEGSRTRDNLRRENQGVFHVTDDVELLARAAVGRLQPPPPLVAATSVRGQILADACRWYAFRIQRWDDESPRANVTCRIVDRGTIREFLGFNCAKHAVVEAAILATRIDRLPREEILQQFATLSKLVEKTAGDQERRAFEFLREYVHNHTAE